MVIKEVPLIEILFIILEIDFIKMKQRPIYHDHAGHIVLKLQKWQIMWPLLLHKAHTKALFECALNLIFQGCPFGVLQENGYKIYHSKLIHGLLEDDADRRQQMCELFISQFKDDSKLFNKMWCDEASFKLIDTTV